MQVNRDFIQPAIPNVEFLDESLLGLCVPEEPDTTFGSYAISHRAPSPVKGGKSRKRRRQSAPFPPAGILLCFHFALRKGRRKTVMPFSRFCKRAFAPDGLTRSDPNWAATGSSAT